MSAICRSCLEPAESKMYPLQGYIANVNIAIAEMLMYCTSKEVKIEENWPTQVCTPCFKTIRIAYNFLKQFEESQYVLEQKIKPGNVQNENEFLSEQETPDTNTENSEQQQYEVEDFHNYAEKWTGVESNEFNNELDATQFSETGLEATDEHYQDEVTYIDDGSEIPIKVVFANLDKNILIEDNTVEECLTQQVLDENESKSNSNNQLRIRKKFSFKKNNSSSYLSHKCPLCSQSARTYRSFGNHLLKHKTEAIVCTKCNHNPEFSTRDFIKHYRDCHRFECQFCLKNLKTNYGYMYHTSMHLVSQETSKKFKCTFEGCNKEFVLLNMWKTHLKNHLRFSKTYQCEKCSRTFKQYDAFKYHQKTHDGIRNHLCSLCGKRFFQAVHLRDHMYRHIGYKQFACQLCNHAAFVTKHQLQKHIKYCSRKF